MADEKSWKKILQCVCARIPLLEEDFTNFLDVECQACGAEPGEPCVKHWHGDVTEASYVHRERVTGARWTTQIAKAIEESSEAVRQFLQTNERIPLFGPPGICKSELLMEASAGEDRTIVEFTDGEADRTVKPTWNIASDAMINRSLVDYPHAIEEAPVKGCDCDACTEDDSDWTRSPDTKPEAPDGPPTERIVQAPPPSEAPCRQCARMNDLGAAKCWWCETPDPTRGT